MDHKSTSRVLLAAFCDACRISSGWNYFHHGAELGFADLLVHFNIRATSPWPQRLGWFARRLISIQISDCNSDCHHFSIMPALEIFARLWSFGGGARDFFGV